jgi:hypothetical protein
MPSAAKARRSRAQKPSELKVRKEHARLRALGLRHVEIWLPDVRSRAFRAEAHRQSVAVAASARARDDQAFINVLSDQGDE